MSPVYISSDTERLFYISRTKIRSNLPDQVLPGNQAGHRDHRPKEIVHHRENPDFHLRITFHDL